MQDNTSAIHKPVEEAFTSQLAIFRALIEHSSDVIIISDENGIERYISPSITNVLGYQPEELLSKSQYLLHHPDDRDRVRDIFFGFVKSRSATPITFSWRFLHKDGSWRWIEATASNQLDNPLIRGIILNFRDISERKALEARIERDSIRFRAMMDAIHDQIEIYDTNGKVLFASKIPEYLVSSTDELNKRDELLWWVHPDDRPRVVQQFTELVSGQTHEVLSEYRVLADDGCLRYVETFATNQVDNEAIGGILANVRDITERKQFEESLRLAKEKAEADALEIERSNLEIRLRNRDLKKLNEEKNELLQVVSHDLKNPLYNIQHEARAILTSPDEAERHAGGVLQCADKMLRLITNFLSIHAIEAGRITLQIEPVDVSEKLNRVLTSYQETVRHKTIRVQTDLPGQPVFTLADRAALYQILDNLISNAIKYSPTGGQVHLSVSASAGAVMVRIQDEGVGVPLDEVDRLFQKFTKLSTRPTAGESSSGLGLAIARKLVKLLHGDIWYEHHPGQGATFVIELPIALTLAS
ncbi:PAS domain-containing sensor histidine kinase [Fibrisoma montanum]|uniref:histidine kinase n=1 Tax=Fibrisoma montanum TaxID=2305895 RepID=A0A418MHI8_9BACT|nr:PAS domain S-box protein [Fibrisoma montanum]RIV26875.1 PAS domain-containing sensor histidine kinase [Fibrisoma montanum]